MADIFKSDVSFQLFRFVTKLLSSSLKTCRCTDGIFFTHGQSDEVFTADIHMKGSQGLNLNFDKLQAWRDLSDRVMPLGALFDATLRTIDALHKIGQQGTPLTGRDNFFVTQRSLLLGIKSSAEVLQNRIKGVIDLVRHWIHCSGLSKSLSDQECLPIACRHP